MPPTDRQGRQGQVCFGAQPGPLATEPHSTEPKAVACRPERPSRQHDTLSRNHGEAPWSGSLPGRLRVPGGVGLGRQPRSPVAPGPRGCSPGGPGGRDGARALVRAPLTAPPECSRLVARCSDSVRRAGYTRRLRQAPPGQRSHTRAFPGKAWSPVEPPLEGAWRTGGDEGLGVPVAPGPSGGDRSGVWGEPGQWPLWLGDLAAATDLLSLVTDLPPNAGRGTY